MPNASPIAARSASTEDDLRLVGSDRVLAVLAELARHPQGIGLDEMSRAVDSAKATVHRALASLRRAGFARQDVHGHYLLGDELIRLAFTNHEARPEHLRVVPALKALCEEFGETVHYAVLENSEIVYRAKVDPPVGAMKLSSTVGGRNPAYCTAVGRLLLGYQLNDEVTTRKWLSEQAFVKQTSRTPVATAKISQLLARARADGYAVDDQENEVGINCLAVPVWLTSSRVPDGAISVSALAHRVPLGELVAKVDHIRELVQSCL